MHAGSWFPLCRCSCSCSSTHVLVLLLVVVAASAEPNSSNFTFHGFSGSGRTSLSLDGIAATTATGLLELTNFTNNADGHAFFSTPFQFKHADPVVSSFSTTFVFAIVSEYPDVGMHGIAFVMSPTKDLSRALSNQYLGLFNASNNGNKTNHILAIEVDTVQNPEFGDINNNHVGINVNGLTSVISRTAGWYAEDKVAGMETFKNLSLISSDPIQVWVEYDGGTRRLDVTLAPLGVAKPQRKLLSSATLNLSDVLLQSMYLGFSSSTGSVVTSHYILGWSFAVGEWVEAPALDPNKLPKVPRRKTGQRGKISGAMVTVIILATAAATLAAGTSVVVVVRRRRMFAEVLEDWELEYGPRRYRYKDLYKAAKGFTDKELLGVGGFGRVYRGILPCDGNNNERQKVAIKRVSHDSKQGVREFVAEIASLGQIRHRNLVQLLGYCRREGELLLVYEYMSNGSLDNYLYSDQDETLSTASSTRLLTIDWNMRFHIIKGVASGLLYLHEDCDKVVVHRDVKASNVLLDADMNGRLGDFGLARLYDRGGDPRTTRVVGTMGYLAPELSRTGRATTAVDVFAFGAFLLEVACGRRPIEPLAQQLLLLDWVANLWRVGKILTAVDPKLDGKYEVPEMEMVLKLGLFCSHPSPADRPSMRQVVQFLYGSVPLQELSSDHIQAIATNLLKGGDPALSFPSSSSSMYVASDLGSSVSGGR